MKTHITVPYRIDGAVETEIMYWVMKNQDKCFWVDVGMVTLEFSNEEDAIIFKLKFGYDTGNIA